MSVARDLNSHIDINNTLNLYSSLIRLAQLQHDSVDRLALQEAAESAIKKYVKNAKGQLKTVSEHLQLPRPRWLRAPDVAALPALIYVRSGNRLGEWGILRGKNAQGQWISEWWDVKEGRWQEQADSEFTEHDFAVLKLSQPFVATSSPVYQLIRQEVFTHRKLLFEAVIGGVVINVIALTTSLYSMQIYDRVVPTGATQTL